MRPEPLETVRALRRRSVAEARQSLAASTEAAAAAAAEARELERQIETETERACHPEGTDQLVEAFAAWLPGARNAALQARAQCESKEAEASRRRAELAACRTALESIESLIAERAAARSQARLRVEQHELDEIGRRRPTPPN